MPVSGAREAQDCGGDGANALPRRRPSNSCIICSPVVSGRIISMKTWTKSIENRLRAIKTTIEMDRGSFFSEKLDSRLLYLAMRNGVGGRATAGCAQLAGNRPGQHKAAQTRRAIPHKSLWRRQVHLLHGPCARETWG